MKSWLVCQSNKASLICQESGTLDSGTKKWFKEINKCVSAVTWVSRPSLLLALSTTKLFSLSFDFVIYPVSFLFLIYLVSVACSKGTLANA